ncbi:hypothetical protein GCM10018773_50850 [Streptomyces candidus]|nr:hypothetical protein GCM10018773_50850 [Streptomyces candidus]
MTVPYIHPRTARPPRPDPRADLSHPRGVFSFYGPYPGPTDEAREDGGKWNQSFRLSEFTAWNVSPGSDRSQRP